MHDTAPRRSWVLVIQCYKLGPRIPAIYGRKRRRGNKGAKNPKNLFMCLLRFFGVWGFLVVSFSVKKSQQNCEPYLDLNLQRWLSDFLVQISDMMYFFIMNKTNCCRTLNWHFFPFHCRTFISQSLWSPIFLISFKSVLPLLSLFNQLSIHDLERMWELSSTPVSG